MRSTPIEVGHRAATKQSLSIVIPVYNDPKWIEGTVADAVEAVKRSSFLEPEIVIVDDGSDSETQAVLGRLSAPFPLTVVRQENQGRIGARRTGLRAARGGLVLLLDARVSLQPDGLRFVTTALEWDSSLTVWNAHCETLLEGNPYARFWNVLTEIAYRDYLSNPRTMSYGAEQFDRYPKGAGCFLAPRVALLDAIEKFDSRYDDPRNANDDTSVIRVLAAQLPINLSPGFACTYRSRDSLMPFLRHAHHRGVVFVDGWARTGGRFFGAILAFYPLSALAIATGVKRPRAALCAIAFAPAAGVGLGIAWRRSTADCAALGALGAPWLCFYGAGMWRGLWLALRARSTRRLRVAKP